jgi:hypothetical protein
VDASTVKSPCTDCQGLTSASMQPTRAHPYLVFSGTSRVTGAREFLCVLCRSTFSFEPPHAGIDSPMGEYRVVEKAREESEDYSGQVHIDHTTPDNEGTGGQL